MINNNDNNARYNQGTLYCQPCIMLLYTFENNGNAMETIIIQQVQDLRSYVV